MRAKGTGTIVKYGYIVHESGGIAVGEHVLVAEKALGKRLPSGAIVHHVDKNPQNNAPANLVVCPSRAYHHLIHVRMRAVAACGNPNWRKCRICKRYDDPANLVISGSRRWHHACWAKRCGWKRKYRPRGFKRILTANGISLTIEEWTQRLGCSESLIRQRIDSLGWDEARAVLTPPRREMARPRGAAATAHRTA